MSIGIKDKRRPCLVMSSIGFVVGLAAGPSIVRAEGNGMQMPMGQTPAAGSQQPATNSPPSGQGMGTMTPGMGARMPGQSPGTTQPGMGGMQGQGAGMTGMMGMMGMMGMGGGAGMGNGQGMDGQGGQMGGMQNSGNQPGVPNAPNGNAAQPTVANASDDTRLYHVGSVDFFLDQASKLNFTDKQTTDLTEIKRTALAQTSDLQAKIVRAEQELFALTGADSPNESTIATKVKEIEKLRTDQRLGFIKSVGKANKVLNADQRKSFLAH